jgi:hypothetical protein
MSKAMGRPPKGDRPMTAAELQREYEQRLREQGIPKKDVMLRLIGAAILAEMPDLPPDLHERIIQRAMEEGEKKGYKGEEIRKKIEGE